MQIQAKPRVVTEALIAIAVLALTATAGTARPSAFARASSRSQMVFAARVDNCWPTTTRAR